MEIYSENGDIKDAVVIDKMTNNAGSIKETVWDNCCDLASDIYNGNLLTYRQKTNSSKITTVKVTIPKMDILTSLMIRKIRRLFHQLMHLIVFFNLKDFMET